MRNEYSFKVENESGERLDKYIASKLDDYSRGNIQSLIKDKDITVNSNSQKSNYRLKINDVINIVIPKDEATVIKPQKMNLDIIYEDEDMLIVNKERGVLVHPTHQVYENTLVNGLLHYTNGELSTIGEDFRPGIVHRIDKDTSGLLIVAKNNDIHEKLALMVKNYNIIRKYQTIVLGNFAADELEGQINAKIGRNPRDRTKMATIETNSRRALTHYRVIEQFNDFSILEVQLETGRTHQIRVHMQHMNRFVLGDTMYGPKRQPLRTDGQVLHAKSLEFIHPITKEHLKIESDLPGYFDEIIDKINKM